MVGPTGPKEDEQNEQSKGSGLRRPEPRFLAVGRIIKAHGVRGELSMEVLTEFPERFETTEWLYLGDPFEATPYLLETYRWHKKHMLLTLGGVEDRDAAQVLKGLLVQVPIEEATPLPVGSYYLYELIGLEVITIEGESLGTVGDIMETGANDVFIVKTEGKDLLIPDIPDVVKEIDMEKQQIVIELLDGLI